PFGDINLISCFVLLQTTPAQEQMSSGAIKYFSLSDKNCRTDAKPYSQLQRSVAGTFGSATL
ncbi:MAG TPA: hypothetical protein VIR78_03760, partial [Malonomonas sp.]